MKRSEVASACPYCDGPWSTSTGPDRVVGAAARSLFGIHAPLPDDLALEYCPRCCIRNMTPELRAALERAEDSWLSRRPE